MYGWIKENILRRDVDFEWKHSTQSALRQIFVFLKWIGILFALNAFDGISEKFNPSSSRDIWAVDFDIWAFEARQNNPLILIYL